MSSNTCQGCRYLSGRTPNFTCLTGCFLGVLDADTALPIFACNHGPYTERVDQSDTPLTDAAKMPFHAIRLTMDVFGKYDTSVHFVTAGACADIERKLRAEIETREAAVKDALIKLGWRPPE